MCGIIGYIGKQQASPILLEALRRLEYRGYDSAGVAVLKRGDLDIVKREEFEAFKEMVRLVREENEALKARIAALEARQHEGGRCRQALSTMRRPLPVRNTLRTR